VTIGSRLFQFFGGFLPIVTDEQGFKSSSSKNVCHKPAHTEKEPPILAAVSI
jgi:hypothetical protein